MSRSWRTGATALGIAVVGALLGSVPTGPGSAPLPPPATPAPSTSGPGVPALSPPPSSPTTSPGGSAPGPTEVLSIELPRIAYTSRVPTMAVKETGSIDPPGFRHTYWVGDRGVMPSASATDTTYFACHTNPRKSAYAVPCNRVPGTVRVGDEVVVRTDAATLRYEITQARNVRRDAFASDRDVWDVNPGRLVWVTCYLSGGNRTDFNFVIIAELVR